MYTIYKILHIPTGLYVGYQGPWRVDEVKCLTTHEAEAYLLKYKYYYIIKDSLILKGDNIDWRYDPDPVVYKTINRYEFEIIEVEFFV